MLECVGSVTVNVSVPGFEATNETTVGGVGMVVADPVAAGEDPAAFVATIE
jgi:hypothetical protein